MKSTVCKSWARTDYRRGDRRRRNPPERDGAIGRPQPNRLGTRIIRSYVILAQTLAQRPMIKLDFGFEKKKRRTKANVADLSAIKSI